MGGGAVDYLVQLDNCNSGGNFGIQKLQETASVRKCADTWGTAQRRKP